MRVSSVIHCLQILINSIPHGDGAPVEIFAVKKEILLIWIKQKKDWTQNPDIKVMGRWVI